MIALGQNSGYDNSLKVLTLFRIFPYVYPVYNLVDLNQSWASLPGRRAQHQREIESGLKYDKALIEYQKYVKSK